MPEALALVSALDETREVRHHEAVDGAVPDDAQHGTQRREWEVPYLRSGRRHARQERRLAGAGQTDEPDVGEQLELEVDGELGAGPAAL